MAPIWSVRVLYISFFFRKEVSRRKGCDGFSLLREYKTHPLWLLSIEYSCSFHESLCACNDRPTVPRGRTESAHQPLPSKVRITIIWMMSKDTKLNEGTCIHPLCIITEPKSSTCWSWLVGSILNVALQQYALISGRENERKSCFFPSSFLLLLLLKILRWVV